MGHPRIQPIHAGHYTMPADGDRFPGERIVVTAFVIEHPRGVFLFDTGFSPEPRKMVDLYRPVYMRPIHEALRAAGHGITDVKLVANCHFHADHAGGNRHFTRTPIFVQKRELAHARKESDYTHHPTSPIFPAPRWKRSMERPSPGPASTSCPRPDTRPATSRSSSIRKRAASFWPDKR